MPTTKKKKITSPQPCLFDAASELEAAATDTAAPAKPSTPQPRLMRVFANDEIANSMIFLPQAADFQSLEDFRALLAAKLPYNATETRERRANYIINRFYANDTINTPLTFFASHCSTRSDLAPAVFYHILKAEPMACKVAEELVWPALPIGRIGREPLREFLLRYLPSIGESTQGNMLRSLLYTYDLLGIGQIEDDWLHFRLHQGTLESLLYILTSEYPTPGMYAFDGLYSGPLHRWLLWDREWLRLQLYNLQDCGILAKVSEIDTVRQFTLAVDQFTALRQFFEQRGRSATTSGKIPLERNPEEDGNAST